MPDADALPDRPEIIAMTGVYNADGGLVGEVRYVVGHLLGRTECALCDITHSPLRRKAAWDRMIRRFEVPIELVHRNETDDALTAHIGDEPLPAVFARWDDGTITVVLSAARLAAVDGSVDEFERTLRSTIAGSAAAFSGPDER